ncbi:hypothetical protein DRH29_05395 [candidate division Kazan bacterium]|uniref:DUF4321 domain-containing protein n=1 Tax=candidate division Kazan bacterium TaxID=2202143 RepID=A0A420ZB68_UNCK3|nr:MAG: hypothetical protein DRH29_05395 [candidate division Kazan bacterium]
MKKHNVGFICLILLLAIIIGGYIGELITILLPEGGVKTFFSRSVEFGFDTISVNLVLIQFDLGLLVKFNIISLLALLVVAYYFRWWF